MTQATATPMPPARCAADRRSHGLSFQQQAVRYALLSGLSFAGNLGLVVLLHEVIGLSSYLAVPIAMLCVTLFNFCTLKLAIFTQANRHWSRQLAGFLASIAGFRLAEYLCFLLLHGGLALPYLPAYGAILIVSAGCKFLFLRNILFAASGKTSHTSEPSP